MRERAMKIGKIGKTYLGNPVRVPVEIGIKRAITENIR